ncbi:hypothetical protein [Nonomuraea harbinensis]|uniref:Uncharacterized protein n=1 Tax=Nonomuraea harbinensis TaxID=1286938 RepID=A0ABW1C6K9_9ACTN|nr:hypothetical protein [Nonomuraea harbinensis]
MLPRRSSGQRSRRTQPRSSSRANACESRLCELCAFAASSLIRSARPGASDHATTKALYAHDPDGLEFEVSWLVPADMIDDELLAARTRVLPLDLAAAKERFGARTRGGVGVSIPV